MNIILRRKLKPTRTQQQINDDFITRTVKKLDSQSPYKTSPKPLYNY